jgi:ligand-binding sensor domain-containing protein
LINSSTFLDVGCNPARIQRVLLLVTTLAVLVNSARALDPKRAFSQYILKQWSTETGFEAGQATAFAQTPDGYLWIGTVEGLFRFDGVNFVNAQQLDPSGTSITGVLGLITDHEGNLWVWTQGLVLRYRGGAFEDVMSSLPPGSFITAMGRGRDGAVLLSNLAGGEIVEGGGNEFKSLATSTIFQTALVISLAQTADGRLWIGTRSEGLLYLSDGQIRSMADGLPDRKINSLLPAKDGKLWIGTDNGLAFWNGTTISNDVPASLRDIQISTLMTDRDANVWVGTSRGLARLNMEGVAFQEQPNQPDNKITALLEDREGNVWIGNTQGMESLRDSPFVTYSVPDGPPSSGKPRGNFQARDFQGCLWPAAERRETEFLPSPRNNESNRSLLRKEGLSRHEFGNG